MSINPLKKATEAARSGSAYTAAEWAKMAEAAGHRDAAAAWWKADREGWDDEHYCPLAAAEHKRKIELKRAGR